MIKHKIKIQIAFYKFGTSLVILVLSGIYYLCEADVNTGGTGVELYYAPMLDYVLTAYIIFWAGTLLLDLLESTAINNTGVSNLIIFKLLNHVRQPPP